MISKEDILSQCKTEKEKNELLTLIRSFLKFAKVNTNKEIPKSLKYPLSIALQYWLNLIRDEISGYRSEKPNWSFYSILYDAIVNKIPINYIGILCPSYKRGKGAIGFKEGPGRTTYIAFNNLKRIYENTINLGISADVRAIFYDIALENLDKLTKKDFDDLKNNIIYDKIISRVHGIPYYIMSKEFPKLSEDFQKCKIYNKEQLLKTISINEKVLQEIIEKNCEFYPENFGWSVQTSKKRALYHAYYYTLESSELKRKFRNPVIVYSAHSYEKAKIYWGKFSDKRIGIIFPKKPVGDSIEPTISIWQTTEIYSKSLASRD